MRYLLMMAVFVVGFLQPFQAGMNATGARHLGSRFQAGWLNGLVNVLLLSFLLLALNFADGRNSGGGLPATTGLRSMPWWAFLAGGIGASIVVVQLTAAPQLGAALLVAIFVAGTAAGSLICDRFGLVGYERIEIPRVRLFGMALVVGGIVLVARPWAPAG